jgi:hypothetical protein
LYVTSGRPCALLQMQYPYHSRLRSQFRPRSGQPFLAAFPLDEKEVLVLAEGEEEVAQLTAMQDYLMETRKCAY